MTAMTAPEATEHATLQLLDMIGASWMSQVICVACELQLPDLLDEKPQTVSALATAARCAESSLQRLLHGLVSLGLCTEQADGRYQLTARGALLRRDAPGGVRAWAVWWGRYLWPVWQDLRLSIESGSSVRELATGRTGYAHIEADAEAAAVFNRSMVELTGLVAGAYARHCDCGDARRIIDIGGGYGALLTAVLESQPQACGVLYDLPHAIDQTRSRLAGSAMAARCEFIAGNFFESVPEGGDLYLLKSILHNWNDGRAAAILHGIRRSMHAQARLAIIERVMPEQISETATAQAVARSDLNMMVGLGGRERTVQEYRTLTAAAGLRVIRVQTLLREYTLIECVGDGTPG